MPERPELPTVQVPNEIEPPLPNVAIPVVPPVLVPPILIPPPVAIVPAPSVPTLDASAETPRQPQAPELQPEVGLPLPGDLETESNIPANAGTNILIPDTFRVGYSDYLRAAEVSQIIAAAVPGVAGILLLTTAGGLVGYRQARAGRAVKTGGTARFLP